MTGKKNQALSENILEQIVGAVRDGVALVDVASPGWRICWFNNAFADLTADTIGALSEASGRELIEQLGGGRAVERLTNAFSAIEQTGMTLLSTESTRQVRPLILNARPLVNDDETFSGRYLLLLRHKEAREQHAEHEQLNFELEAARHRITDMSDDPVTGFASENRFRQLLERDWSLAARKKYGLSLITLTMDGFQEYVDTFGDHATDSCLRMLARTIRRRLRRGSDLAGRAGPSTIIVLMHSAEATAVEAFANSLADDIQALRIHHPKSPAARHVTVQVHTESTKPSGASGYEEFLEKALGDFSRPSAQQAIS